MDNLRIIEDNQVSLRHPSDHVDDPDMRHLDDFVPAAHQLRVIRVMVKAALADAWPRCALTGRLDALRVCPSNYFTLWQPNNGFIYTMDT